MHFTVLLGLDLAHAPRHRESASGRDMRLGNGLATEWRAVPILSESRPEQKGSGLGCYDGTAGCADRVERNSKNPGCHQ